MVNSFCDIVQNITAQTLCRMIYPVLIEGLSGLCFYSQGYTTTQSGENGGRAAADSDWTRRENSEESPKGLEDPRFPQNTR